MWAKIDDQFFDHPKARAAGKDGRALFMAGLCWSAGQLTDGFIAITDLSLIAAKAGVRGAFTARELVNVGLWEKTIGGWRIHDYADFNPSADVVMEIRQQRAKAGRRGGLRSRPPGSKREANPEANASGFAEANGKQNGTPSPSPSPTTTSVVHLQPRTEPSETEEEAPRLSKEDLRQILEPARRTVRADGGVSDLGEDQP